MQSAYHTNIKELLPCMQPTPYHICLNLIVIQYKEKVLANTSYDNIIITIQCLRNNNVTTFKKKILYELTISSE